MLDGSGQRWQVFSPLTTEIPAVLLSVRSFVPSFIEVQCCPLLPLRHLLCFSYSVFFLAKAPQKPTGSCVPAEEAGASCQNIWPSPPAAFSVRIDI